MSNKYLKINFSKANSCLSKKDSYKKSIKKKPKIKSWVDNILNSLRFSQSPYQGARAEFCPSLILGLNNQDRN